MHLLEKTGILSRATEAKEKTEMAEIKERAEMKKLDLNIQSWTSMNKGAIKRTALISAINKEFAGSTASGSVITTKNGYDIRVDKDLNITVVKHQDTGNKKIAISYEKIPTESRAIILRVYATVDGAISYNEYANEYIAEIEDGPELIKIFVDGFNYTMKDDLGGETLTWQQITGGDFSTVDAFYQAKVASSGEFNDYREMMISYRFVNPQGYDEKYGATITCNGESQTTSDYAEFAITSNDEYDIVASNNNGDSGNEIADITECKEEKYSSIYQTNTEMTIEGYKVTIPAGFAVGTSDNVGKVSTGLVITDSVDSDGNSTGNEFVWIPVKEDLTVGNTGKQMATLQTDSTYNYRGVLYDWKTSQDGSTTYDWSSSYTGYREPDIVSYDGGVDDTVGITKPGLQSEYNAMIGSVKAYGGFYVSRYEMSVESGKAISKIAKTPTSAENSETESWYGLYSMAKTYTNSKNSVQSSMIWGSQYDAMLNFALASGNDASKVHSTEYGNYSGNPLKTGLTRTSDVINNVFDLAGNLREWTLEANYTYGRVKRGGDCDDSLSPSTRGNSFPYNTGSNGSSRLALYVALNAG